MALKVEYNIVIRYISLIEFVRFKSNHFFAYNDGKAEIIPLPNYQIQLEKLFVSEIGLESSKSFNVPL